MESRAHYLSVLGLPPEASNEDATAAYKDLIRVWHPDRFQNDDRLRKRAEDQTKLINEAISKVKKLPKEKPASAKSSTKKAARSGRTSSYNDSEQPPHNPFASAAGPSGFTRPRIEIAPLVVKQRRAASLTRACVAVVALLGIASTLQAEPNTPLETCGCLAIGFIATNWLLWNSMLLITRTQVVRVDKLGLYILGIGRLLWPDLRQAWAGRTAGSTYLAITFSDSYVRKRPVLVRLIFWLRSLMSRSHAVIPFSGLNSDAIQVVDAINLRHHTGHIDVPRVNIASSPNLFWCNLLSVVCPIMVFYRCFTQESIETPDYLPYIIIFVLCRLYAVVKLIRFSKVSGL